MVALFACGCRFSGADCGDVDTDGAMEFCPLHEAHRIWADGEQQPDPDLAERSVCATDELLQMF